MIEYTKLFDLLNQRKMKRTDLLEVISSPTLAKLGKNEIVKTDIIDKICLFLEVQPSDIMEVYEYKLLDGQQVKVRTKSPDVSTFGNNEINFLTASELSKYIIEKDGKYILDTEKIMNDAGKLK